MAKKNGFRKWVASYTEIHSHSSSLSEVNLVSEIIL
jgi:hypothetical protein